MEAGNKFRLLSIDGGGIRGIVPALVLAHLERLTNRPVHELFDALAGTSTGGILALGLTKPGAKLGTAAALVNLYRSQAHKIFKEDLVDRLLEAPVDIARMFSKQIPRGFDLSDLFEPRYDAAGREEVFRTYFGETRIQQALKPVFITSYDTERRCPVFFVSRETDAADDPYYDAVADVRMVDAALATSAAPTYFRPHKIERGSGHFSLVDGAIYANNPTGLAHAFLRGAHYGGDVILSLGTGSQQHAYRYDVIKDWGTLVWAPPVIKMTIDAQTEAVSVVMRRRLANTHYLRVQTILQEASENLDDVSEQNLDALTRMAEELIRDNAAALEALCEQLTA